QAEDGIRDRNVTEFRRVLFRSQSNLFIIRKHIIPNAMAPMIIRSTLTIGTAVISTSSLSYLGLGVEAHVPEWGNILRIGSEYLEIGRASCRERGYVVVGGGRSM